MKAETVIDIARVEEADDVLRLLADNRLPLEGLIDHLATTLVAKQGGRIVGSAALEIYRDGALLRSVAVSAEMQGHGLGREMTSAALRLAHERNMPAVYLLTTTAEQYFVRFGFEPITRSDVPATVQASVEFTSACPSSATVMRKLL